MNKIILSIILFGLSGCVSSGYVPHYILSDSPECKGVIEKISEEPSIESLDQVEIEPLSR